MGRVLGGDRELWLKLVKQDGQAVLGKSAFDAASAACSNSRLLILARVELTGQLRWKLAKVAGLPAHDKAGITATQLFRQAVLEGAGAARVCGISAEAHTAAGGPDQ
jgi:hypothetical protein